MVVSNLSGGGVEESKSPSQQQPCLLITDCGKSFRIQTNMFNDKPQLIYDVGGEFPEFLDRNVRCSFGEWVILTGSSSDNDVLVNLLSKEVIELPSLDMTYGFCTLTSHPYDPTCHIVYFNEDGRGEGETACIFCQPGDKEFTIKILNYEFYPPGVRAVVDGKLFLKIFEPIPSSSSMTVGIVEFKESTFQFEVVEMDRGFCHFYIDRSFFFESSGELSVVYQLNSSADYTSLIGFEILKADFLNKKWVSVKNLGEVAIFIGYDTAYVQCASVESGITANSIYFLEPDDLENYYIYNLKDGTIRMKPAFSSMERETTKDARLDWVMMPAEASFCKLLKGDQESICQDSEKENKTSVSCSICTDSEKKKKRKREEAGVQNSWNMVPPELLNLIQLHLFGRDNAVFRVVCKAWQQVSIRDYSIPSIPPLLSSTTLLELCQSVSPLLMFQEDITISYDSVPIFRLFDPVHRKWYRTGIPELRETDIHDSRDGWLLVAGRSDESIFFFNPLTREKIELPRIHPAFFAQYYSLSFSSLPTCSNCLVVGMHRDLMLMYTLKHGEETWRRQELDELQTENEREFGHCPVVLNGLHHFMCENRDMVVFNLKDSVEGQLPDCQSWSSKLKRSARGHDFFLEIDGALAFVSVEANGGGISIFKWNGLETGWGLMKDGVDFGGKEMFLSKRGSFMEKIDDVGGMGNTMFLPMIDDAKEGVFYSLATHSYHTFYSSYSSKLPHNVDKFLNGIWIKPDRKIVGDSNLKWFI